MSHLENDRLKEQIHEAKQETTMHTPTPWKIEEIDNLIIGYKQWELKNSDNVIATIALHRPDAEFIVTAVNSHEDLIETIKKSISCLKSSPNEPDKVICVAGWLSFALAKAGVKV